MPSKRRRAAPARATRAEVAAYANAHPSEIESLAEMLPEERAEHVARIGRANDLPQPTHGDNLRQELTDLLGMLDAALAEADSKPQYNSQVVYDLVRDSRALLRSILGTPQEQTHTTDGRKLPKRS